MLGFLAEARAHLCGTQRRGETITTREVAQQNRQFRKLLPAHVQAVRVRGDGEFIGWESVQACREKRFEFAFGDKPCAPSSTPRRAMPATPCGRQSWNR